MSADLDIEDLEDAREELTEVVMTMLEVSFLNAAARDGLTPALFKIGSAVGTINRAIEACGKPAERKGANDG